MNWFKSMDGYGKFLFVLLGIPAIIAAIAIAGLCGVAIVKNNGWYTIPIMIFYPPLTIALAMGMMGAAGGGDGPSVFYSSDSEAKKVCIFWAFTSGLATVVLGVSGIIVYYTSIALHSMGVL